jgi:hypothetical protein
MSVRGQLSWQPKVKKQPPMKKLAIALCLTASVLTAMAQGTINFNNRVTVAGINAPVTFAGSGLLGPDYVGQLFVMNGASYEAVGTPTAFQSNALLAGYVNGGNTVVPFVAPGSDATVILRAWNAAAGSDWATASGAGNLISGESTAITITTGGAGAPPSLPANLTGLAGFELVAVPEPSTIALGVIGLAALALRRRK